MEPNSDPDIARPHNRRHCGYAARFCLGLLLGSLCFAAANESRSIIQFIGLDRELEPLLNVILVLYTVVCVAGAFLHAYYWWKVGAQSDMQSAPPRNDAMSSANPLGVLPRSGSYFRPILKDIHRTARRWKKGSRGFWTGMWAKRGP